MIVETRENYQVDGFLMKDWTVPDDDTPPFEHEIGTQTRRLAHNRSRRGSLMAFQMRR